MASVTVAPTQIKGPWEEGYALDHHTVSSTFLGYDALGNPNFDTRRTPLGELVFRLKNRGDRTVLDAIADTAAEFIKGRQLHCDLIAPVPPSRQRSFQPTVEIARAISARIGKPTVENCLRKVRATPELKNVYDYQQRLALLEGAFEVDAARVRGQSILLLDDLYRSGATLKALAKALRAAEPTRIVALALTRTRTRL
jgi:predicted amidophosphoribosyltransferase